MMMEGVGVDEGSEVAAVAAELSAWVGQGGY